MRFAACVALGLVTGALAVACEAGVPPAVPALARCASPEVISAEPPAQLEVCMRKCQEKSEGAACATSAAALQDPGEASRLYARACDLGTRAACARVADATSQACDPGRGSRVGCTEGVVWLERACSPMPAHGDPCLAMRSRGDDLARVLCASDPATCKELAEPIASRCTTERVSPSACRSYAPLAELVCKRDAPADCVAFAWPLEAACLKGSHDDCERLTAALATNAARFCPAKVVDEREVIACSEACDKGGNVEACVASGEMDAGGRGAWWTLETRAVTRLGKACEATKGRRGCVELARVVAGDTMWAATSLAMACNARVEAGCARVVAMVGEKGKAAPLPAISAVRRLCVERHDAAACARLVAAGL